MTDLAYAAHTTNAIFFLDSEGVCRSVTPLSEDAGPVSPELARCLGAQYVAALDVAEPGGLMGVPKPGSALLFVADRRSRFSLLRTAPLVSFESLAAPAPAPTHAAVDEAIEQALTLASMFEVKVTWPSAKELARQLPFTHARPALMAASFT